MIFEIILFLLIGISMYLILGKVIENKYLDKLNNYLTIKNERYYEDLLKYYDKNKKLNLKKRINFFRKIEILLDRCGLRNNLFFNPLTIIFTGIICVIIVYLIAFEFFKIILLSCIIAVPFFYLPVAIFNGIANYKEEKIEKVFLNFLLQLKNHTKINNDIVLAMKEVRTIEPLQSYIKKFLIEVSSGIRFEKAIEHFRERINIKQIKSFLNNLEHCYLYGGSFSNLIDKSYKMIEDIQKEKIKRVEETKGARMVLVILIALDFLVYISFIQSDQENYLIMKKTIIGNMILYWNFISMWILVWISNLVKRLDY